VAADDEVHRLFGQAAAKFGHALKNRSRRRTKGARVEVRHLWVVHHAGPRRLPSRIIHVKPYSERTVSAKSICNLD
jgi:hypothetical protein